MLNRKKTIAFLVVYGLLTLVARFMIEMSYSLSAFTSLILGGACLMSVFLMFRFGILTLKT